MRGERCPKKKDEDLPRPFGIFLIDLSIFLF